MIAFAAASPESVLLFTFLAKLHGQTLSFVLSETSASLGQGR